MARTIKQLDTIETVVVGIQGPVGPQGPAGVDGADAFDLTYHHIQGLPSATWIITHNMGKYPSVLVIDSAGNEVTGSIVFNSVNQITVTFSGGFSGDAYLN